MHASRLSSKNSSPLYQLALTPADPPRLPGRVACRIPCRPTVVLPYLSEGNSSSAFGDAVSHRLHEHRNRCWRPSHRSALEFQLSGRVHSRLLPRRLHIHPTDRSGQDFPIFVCSCSMVDSCQSDLRLLLNMVPPLHRHAGLRAGPSHQA